MNDDRLSPKPDPLQHGVILVLLIAAVLSFVLAAEDTALPGLKHAAMGLGFAGIAAHLIRVGRLY